MAFTAKILSWRFRHLNIVGCLLKEGLPKGGYVHPTTPPPPSYALEAVSCFNILTFYLSDWRSLKLCTHKYLSFQNTFILFTLRFHLAEHTYLSIFFLPKRFHFRGRLIVNGQKRTFLK